MQTENEIVGKLCGKFGFLQDKVHVQRQKRIFTEFLAKEEFEQVLHYAHDELGFYRASHVVGTDEGDDLGFIYLLSDENGVILALKEKAPKSDPVINSMTDLYPSLEQHERELVDLFGAVVEGLPEGPSYPLPDGWPKGSYPMRKDWDPKYFDRNTMTYDPPSDDVKKEGGNK
ncbi:MAG TPA: NADH-quinone oxidoreductase subunit C [Clostridiales bacterium]|nr:NADH-quinone oxidoreductase subunit C [Clostridiales bacterium]HOL92070.1 NADH-quinone oxidoreductase subunit C [Clostridiales bacterium]HPP34870.1 NADH-quinone oxidoreductase subunit C [Clostridiales bacterium]